MCSEKGKAVECYDIWNTWGASLEYVQYKGSTIGRRANLPICDYEVLVQNFVTQLQVWVFSGDPFLNGQQVQKRQQD